MRIEQTSNLNLLSVSSLSPTGFEISLKIRFGEPYRYQNTFPERFVDWYTSNGLQVFSPLLKWAYSTQQGVIRWSDIEQTDPKNLFGKAAEFGLGFGCVCTVSEASGVRSIGTFSRGDREMSDEELQVLHQHLLTKHEFAAVPQGITEKEREVLVRLASGMTMDEIGYELGISKSGAKVRLDAARRKLNASNATHAVALAKHYRLI